MNVEEIRGPIGADGSDLLAILIRADECPEGIKFYTRREEPLQVGVMSYANGKAIPPHKHKYRTMSGEGTQEVMIVKHGLIVATIYTDYGHPVATRSLLAGDVLVLLSGGHRFEFRPGAGAIEIKQGPYLGIEDKIPLEVQ